MPHDDGAPTYGDGSKEGHPVVCTDWSQARVYCEWTGARLPTEAQWEKAARGTDERVYPWGNGDPSCEKVNSCDDNEGDHCVGHTTDVGSYPSGASPYGALDMAGNVWDWVADYYADDYYTSSPANNPQGPESGRVRVLRGGCWLYALPDIRTAFRVYDPPSIPRYNVGFRYAVSQGERSTAPRSYRTTSIYPSPQRGRRRSCAGPTRG